MDDIRFTLRRLAARRVATAASIAALAFSIGAAAVTWAALDAVLLHPLPVHDPERLVVLGTDEGRDIYTGSLYPRLQMIRESGAFGQVAAQWESTQPVLATVRGANTTVNAGFATHDYWETIGVRPVLGRAFTSHEDRRGAHPVALLTERYWRRVFGSDPAVLSSSIELSGRTVPIVGVLPRGFRGLTLSDPVDLYLPFHTIADLGSRHINYLAERGEGLSSPTSGVMILGRLHPGASIAETSERLNALQPEPPPGRSAPRVALVDVNTAAVPARARTSMHEFSKLLVATVAMLLLIGCTTVGMLLLIRTEARRSELAMCMALGATRGRLARDVAAEGALLAAGGVVFGLPVAWWLFGVLGTFQLPGDVSIESLELGLDVSVVVSTMTAAFFATLIVAGVGSLMGFRTDVAEALRSSSGTTARIRRGPRGGIVGLQTAVALTLLSGTGLLARSLMAALSLNDGIRMESIVSAGINLFPYGYTPERARDFFEAVVSQLRANPRVDALAVSVSDGGMGAGGTIVVDGVRRTFPSTVWDTHVEPAYFATIGARVLEGRSFTAGDRPGTPRVAIVSESYGRLLANGESPLGVRITATSSRRGEPADVMEVVGVVSDVITNVQNLQPLAMYLPLAQTAPATTRTITIRTDHAERVKQDILAAIASIDSRIRPVPPVTLKQRIERQMSSQMFGATVLGTLGVLALLLTLLGAYVLAESMASMRLREMGIRAALGATRRQLAKILLLETARLVAVGLAGGLAVSWLGATTIRAFLFRVQPSDPMTLLSAATLILVLTLAVSVRAARRASRADIAQVLKST